MGTIEAAFFDLGGVVMASGAPRELLEVYEGADLATLTLLFLGPDDDGDHPWHRAERGEITIADAWPQIHALMTDAGVTRRADHTPAPSTQEWRVNEPVVEVLTDLRTHGITTSIITNNIAEFRSRWWGVLPFDELFDDVVDSHEVGMRKPAPAIYELAMRRVGLTDPSRGVFLDDVMRNVEGAEAVGLHGIFVDVDPQPAVDALRALALG
jgi:epoxide hydrolase-like predicted phosphatase